MTDATNGEDAGVTLQSLATRLDDLTREVRRQGRAAVAAQAAAESCLEKLAAQDEGDGDGDGEPDQSEPERRADTAWLRAIVPVADALDRIVAQASAMLARRPGPPPPARQGLLSLFAPAPPPPRDPGREADLHALAEGVRVLRAQLTGALEGCGVQTDRRVGVAIDPDVHRVVELRALRAGEHADVVLEVVRPGYAVDGRIVREAEVVAGAGKAPGT